MPNWAAAGPGRPPMSFSFSGELMRPSHMLRGVVLLAVLIACGCDSNNKGKLEGTKWSSDRATIKGKFIPAGTLFLDFRKDGTLAGYFDRQQISGTYSLGWGDRVSLRLDQTLITGRNHTESVVIDRDSMTMTDADGTRMTFRKVN
jgi:hypothetical protein